MKSGLWSWQKRSGVVSCAVSPNGRMAVAGYDAGFFPLLWEVSTGRMIAVLTGAIGEMASVSFSPNGRFIAVEDRKKAIKCWNIEQPKPFQLPLIMRPINIDFALR